MNTRAKVKCSSVEKYENWDKEKAPFLYRAKFGVVSSGSPENAAFFGSTPTGQIELSTVRDDHFVPGKSYYVDFTEAE